MSAAVTSSFLLFSEVASRWFALENTCRCFCDPSYSPSHLHLLIWGRFIGAADSVQTEPSSPSHSPGSSGADEWFYICDLIFQSLTRTYKCSLTFNNTTVEQTEHHSSFIPLYFLRLQTWSRDPWNTPHRAETQQVSKSQRLEHECVGSPKVSPILLGPHYQFWFKHPSFCLCQQWATQKLYLS